MTDIFIRTAESARALATSWLRHFADAIGDANPTRLAALFEPDAGWRDLMALTLNVRQAHSATEIVELLLAVIPQMKPRDFRLDEERPAPSPTATTPPRIELFFEFETDLGHVRAVAYLSEKGLASTLMTQLTELSAAPPVWPKTGRFDEQHPTTRWRDHVAEKASFDGEDPEVLIVGGGQFGVMTAAHLARQGIEALIIDRLPQVGDAWRTRYEALMLHQPYGILQFPFLRFPESFPEYIPKDKFADWFELYVRALDLNFWCSTTFQGGDYDEDNGTWAVTLELADGTIRVMHPKHLVLAAGGLSVPEYPSLPALTDFAGETLHATQYVDNSPYAGKDVLVVGVGTTAHDIALDITKAGGRAVLLQRSPLIVIDLPTANKMYGDYVDPTASTELIDVRFLAGAVYPQLRSGFLEFQKGVADLDDAELRAGLEAAGMKLWAGEDRTGFYYSFLRTLGGFYINVGASDAIVRGDISVLQHDDLQHFVACGVVLNDGSTKDFDAVIFATGARPPIDGIAGLLGESVAARLGDVWGFDSDGEMANVFKPTSQPGLWIMMGSVPQARWHSPLVAMRIAAELRGLVPAEFRNPEHLTWRRPAAIVAVDNGRHIADAPVILTDAAVG